MECPSEESEGSRIIIARAMRSFVVLSFENYHISIQGREKHFRMYFCASKDARIGKYTDFYRYFEMLILFHSNSIVNYEE